MSNQFYTLGNNRFELLCDGDIYKGIGIVEIGSKKVRSGRLPLRVYSQTFSGLQLSTLRVVGVDESLLEVRVRLLAEFTPLPVKMLRDHSFDPIHDLGDWGEDDIAGTGNLDMVFRLATDSFNGVDFAGFSYHYEYHSDSTALFYLYDMASWELDGDICGAIAYSQSSCSPPVASFTADTSWSTEGILHFLIESGNQNPIMTHNLPRWCSHGSFDFQYKGNDTLIGVFEHVDLIRSVICRDAGKAELKHFDKHIFDENLSYITSPKKVLLNSDVKSNTMQKNLWTWIYQEVDNRARAEFGLIEEPMTINISENLWSNFTVDCYYKDLLPAASAIGAGMIFVDNLKKSAMTERAPLPGVFNWNMCSPHEYEISAALGGVKRVRDFVDRAREANVRVMVWSNNAQALSSPLNQAERWHEDSWYLMLEDTRQKYGGAYMGILSVLDFSIKAAYDYFVSTHKKLKEDTGIDAIMFDSFYNMGFMPITYREMRPRTTWRQCLQAMRELQEVGIAIIIESFGAFGLPQHGHPSSYNLENIFACYRVGLGNDYNTIPTGHPVFSGHPAGIDIDFYCLAHMAGIPSGRLFINKVRIDKVWSSEEVQIVAIYHQQLPQLAQRYLQEDGKSVLWHSADGHQATLWNFSERSVALPGTVTDLCSNEILPTASSYQLLPRHIYTITDASLPVTIG